MSASRCTITLCTPEAPLNGARHERATADGRCALRDSPRLAVFIAMPILRKCAGYRYTAQRDGSRLACEAPTANPHERALTYRAPGTQTRPYPRTALRRHARGRDKPARHLPPRPPRDHPSLDFCRRTTAATSASPLRALRQRTPARRTTLTSLLRRARRHACTCPPTSRRPTNLAIAGATYSRVKVPESRSLRRRERPDAEQVQMV